MNTRSQPDTRRRPIYILLALALLMAVTRSHHFAGIDRLPDASWAAFFLAGFAISRAWTLPLLCLVAAGVDYVAIEWGGVSSFCVTPAYAMLLPSYAALWLGGRWYARHHRATWSTLGRLAAAVMSSALIAELLASGGFYFLGGRYTEPTLAGFLPRLAAYFPGMLGAIVLYVALAALLHAFAGNLGNVGVGKRRHPGQ